MPESTPKNVLILCSGNSCRSQIAEAIINARLRESWRAYSAGTNPAGYIHPQALAVLKEIGIMHQGSSKNIADLPIQDFDLVITVCDQARDSCPTWLGQGKRVHVGFPDPAAAAGSEGEILQVFRTIRDEIEAKLTLLLNTFQNTEKKSSGDEG